LCIGGEGGDDGRRISGNIKIFTQSVEKRRLLKFGSDQ
jgi:hypothetical protein